jgi:hypothetical protein
MSIEDVYYLKNNSMKQNYSFLVDSNDRNLLINPEPNEYIVEFTQPFKNVIGLEIVDASIPRTMYSIDKYNNILYFAITDEDININTLFTKIEISIGNYELLSFIKEFNSLLEEYNITIESVSNPPNLLNKIRFISNNAFILDMNKSTLRHTLGFNLPQTIQTNHRIVENIFKTNETCRYFHSKIDLNNIHTIESNGIIDLIGEKYIILQCPEIESHSTTSLSYSAHTLGLAKFRLGLVGYNDANVSFNKTKIREFHPIGKLTKITLRFITSEGNLYDFKGINHNITFNIIYYEASSHILDEKFSISQLNPNYNPNILNYKYTLDEQDDESDDEDEDNDSILQRYKQNEELILN